VKPRLLDLFCGAGGATKGYQVAGFHVTGVDIKYQPNYCGDEFVQGDAIRRLTEFSLARVDAIHASPPCQAFTRAGHLRTAQGRESSSGDLLTPTLAALKGLTIPWVVENVPGAPIGEYSITLCGSSFGLQVRRHRLFASNVMLMAPPCDHVSQGRPIGVYYRTGEVIPHGGRTARNVAEGRAAMGIDWMTWDELKESIPPAYTEHIGAQLLASVVAA
jgi:DNA (cytosine-5)-methyltransferase 1